MGEIKLIQRGSSEEVLGLEGRTRIDDEVVRAVAGDVRIFMHAVRRIAANQLGIELREEVPAPPEMITAMSALRDELNSRRNAVQ